MPVRHGGNLHLGNIRVTDRSHNAPLVGQLGKQAFRHGGDPALDNDDVIGSGRRMAFREGAFNNRNPIVAGQEFGRDPPATIEMLRREGLAERNIETWRSYVGRWLGVNGQAASRYINDLPGGALRTEGIKQMIYFIDDTGDKDSDALWRKEL